MPSALISVSHRLRRGAVKPFVALALFGSVAGGGVVAYNYLFNRPGESAIQLLPQDALMVMTVDTEPSVEQVPTFKRIYDAIAREGLAGELDKAMTEALDKSPVGAELRPLLSKSFAFAALNTPGMEPGGTPNMAILLAVKDTGKAKGILGKHGAKAARDGLDVYALQKPEAQAALIGPYLVLSNKPEGLAAIRQVEQDRAPALDKSPDYQQARASLPKDANYMLFVSGEGMKQLGKQVTQAQGIVAPESRYFTLGLTLREGGLEITGQVPTALPGDSPFRKLAEVAALDPAVLSRLPTGAYGVFMVSQPGKLWGPAQAVARQAEKSPEMDEALDDFEEETGISVEEELVPALGGHLILAVYADQQKPGAGVDGLILIDDANGATPAAVAEKLRLKLAEEADLELTSREVNGHTVWTAARPMEGKTACYAEAGEGLLLASHPGLLERALEAWDAAGSAGVGGQPAFAGMQKALLPGAQLALMVDLKGVLGAFREPLEGSLKEQPVTFDDVAGVFGSGDTGLTLSAKYDGSVAGFQLFVPLDYEKLVHLLGVGARQINGGRAQPVPPNQAGENSPGITQ